MAQFHLQGRQSQFGLAIILLSEIHELSKLTNTISIGSQQYELTSYPQTQTPKILSIALLSRGCDRSQIACKVAEWDPYYVHSRFREDVAKKDLLSWPPFNHLHILAQCHGRSDCPLCSWQKPVAQNSASMLAKSQGQAAGCERVRVQFATRSAVGLWIRYSMSSAIMSLSCYLKDNE